MTFADKISSVRILLIPVFVSLLIYSPQKELLRYVAAGVFLIAVFTDFLDGLIARIKKEKSELGQIIDPLADKLLLLTAFISLYLLEFTIPLWVVLVVVSRDGVILIGVLTLHLMNKKIQFSPSVWGKLTTFFQMITILSVLLWGGQNIAVWTIWTATVVFTGISGIDYFVRGAKALNGNSRSAART
ncbi:MAG: CDP-diacylglycerol--glycerol-3-phosphate 3-phosphatidyltransferase [Candidatus Omnitrophica bacterium]|nr:CDP-diacylglycerol--glycerol-3-phosphate 3-phosphatidyltransferase [Candidatus Omnitrophota bacterium]